MYQILNFIWMNELIRITKMFLKERMIWRTCHTRFEKIEVSIKIL